MPSEIQQNRYDQMIRRVGGIVGPGSKVAEALTELFPVLELENLPNELQILSGTHIGFGGSSSIGAIAEFPSVQLFNPANSGKIVTITGLYMSLNSQGVIRLGIEGATRGAAVLSESFADSRLGLGANITAQIFFASNVAETKSTGRIFLDTRGKQMLQDHYGLFVLGPGTGLTVGAEEAVTTIQISFWWRERVAEQSELNF